MLFSVNIYGQSNLFTGANFRSTVSVKHDTSHSLELILQIPKDTVRQQGFVLNDDNNVIKNTSGKSSKLKKYNVEQTYFGRRSSPALLASFDGLGEGFIGPQGTSTLRNPSDNSLAVGPDHILQTVNSRMAIFTKKGTRFDTTGKVLYGPVETRNVFRGFGGPCEKINNGDAVVRYDQLADRWLIVMPTFRRLLSRQDTTVHLSQPGKAERLYVPPLVKAGDTASLAPRQARLRNDTGTYCMCYAISTGPDPFGPGEFLSDESVLSYTPTFSTLSTSCHHPVYFNPCHDPILV